jgi:hypothetical protein
MELIAHTTSFELTAEIISFVAGMSVGPWLLHVAYKWWLRAGRS